MPRRHKTLTAAEIEAARDEYAKTGDLAAAAKAAGASVAQVQVLAEVDEWDKLVEERRRATRFSIAQDETGRHELKRKTNDQHYSWIQKVVDAWFDARLATAKDDFAADNMATATRALKNALEAVKAGQFVQRLALGMDTEKVGSEAQDDLLQKLRNAYSEAVAIAASRKPNGGGDDGVPSPPPPN